MPFGYAPDHEVLKPLPGESRSFVILTKRKAEVAVVFVHGFNGDAVRTWGDFETLAAEDPRFRQTDFYFFGYDALFSNVMAAASFLHGMLDQLGRDPLPLLGTLATPEAQMNRKDGYSKIVIVAHSLGGVVSRWVLLRAVEEQAPWVGKLRYLLFAPAHRGSDLAGLATQGAEGISFLKFLVEALKAGSPLVRELDSRSPVLADLERRTKELAAQHACLRATRVVIAEKEMVVNNWIFALDPYPQALRGTNHESVCKPNAVRREPLEILSEVIHQ